MRGKWNGFTYEYPNGETSPYRIEIKEIIAYKYNGFTVYRIEYHDGTVEDVPSEYFHDGAFISNAVKLGKVKKHNGYTVYRGYVYDYRLEVSQN